MSEITVETLIQLLDHSIYIEVYTPQLYFIVYQLASSFCAKKSIILNQRPRVTKNIVTDIARCDIIKINAIALKNGDATEIDDIVQPNTTTISTAWTGNSSMGTIEVINITGNEVNKIHAYTTILKKLSIPFTNLLVVSDSLSDWEFMETCEYVAAVGNSSDKLKQLIQEISYNFIAPHVDDNGLLEAFSYYSLR